MVTQPDPADAGEDPDPATQGGTLIAGGASNPNGGFLGANPGGGVHIPTALPSANIQNLNRSAFTDLLMSRGGRLAQLD